MSFGITELIIVLVIVILLFGTKKLRNLGGDLGGALKSFRGAMKDADELEQSETTNNSQDYFPDNLTLTLALKIFTSSVRGQKFLFHTIQFI
jgi:sec-independent protein translocase protein TatA